MVVNMLYAISENIRCFVLLKIGFLARYILSIFVVFSAVLTVDAQDFGKEVVASNQQKQDAMKSQLAEKVVNRWVHLKDKSFGKAYEYFSPVRRKHTSLDQYKSSIGVSVNWLDAKIASIDVDDERGVVMVDVTYRLSLPGGKGLRLNNEVGNIDKRLREVWVHRENEWWYVNPIDSKL